jgi:hypothetical protein
MYAGGLCVLDKFLPTTFTKKFGKIDTVDDQNDYICHRLQPVG